MKRNAASRVSLAPLLVAAAMLPRITGPYFGQPMPGSRPELFAPDVVERMQITRTPVFVADGREAFWSTGLGQNRGRILTTRLNGDEWPDAEPLPFSNGEFFDHNPAPSHDGQRLVFASNRPIPGKAPTTIPGTSISTSDLWMSERTSSGWSAPTPLALEINTPSDDDLPGLTRDGTLYFGSSRPGAPGPAAIYRSRFVNGRFAPPERLPAPVTTAAGEMFNYIAPDESLVLFLSFGAGTSGGLHVSFRQPDGAWGVPVKLGEEISRLRAYSLTMSPDLRRLFFTSAANKGAPPRVYAVDAEVIDNLRRVSARP